MAHILEIQINSTNSEGSAVAYLTCKVVNWSPYKHSKKNMVYTYTHTQLQVMQHNWKMWVDCPSKEVALVNNFK